MQIVWHMGLAALLAIPASAQASEPVLLAPVQAASAEDAAVAAVVEQKTRDQLLGEGWVVLDSNVVAPVVNGEALERCAMEPVTCAQGVLVGLPVRLAAAARLDRIGDTLIGHVELVAPGGTSPLATVNIPIVSGNEHLFALEVMRLTRGTLEGMDPASSELLAAAARLIAGPDPAPAAPAASVPAAPAPKVGAPPPPATPESKAPVVRGDTVPERLEGTGVRRRRIAGSGRHFLKSNLDPRDYLYRAMPHAGQLILEARAGYAQGDVDRQILLRIEQQGSSVNNAWYREGPALASNFRGSAFIGFAPITALDFGVLVGFQYANRQYTTGTIFLEEDGALDRRVTRAPGVEQALDILLQPRLRVYVVPVGPAKPYIVGGAEFKVFNDYIGDGTFIVPPGGWIPGAVGGAGVVIDPGPVMGLFAEGTYTMHFGSRAALLTESSEPGWGWADGEAPADVNRGHTIAVVGGVQFRL